MKQSEKHGLLILLALWLWSRNSKASGSIVTSPGFVPGGGKFGGGGSTGTYPEAPDLPVQRPIPPNPLRK